MSQQMGVCVIVPRDQEDFRPCVHGMGILVGDREVITCAHVVNEALGKGWELRTGVKVRVCFPVPDGSGGWIDGEVEWIDGAVDTKRLFRPGRRAGERFSDVAVIVFDRDAPATVERADLRPHVARSSVTVYGFRGTWVKDEEGIKEDEWVSHKDGQWADGTVAGPQPGMRAQFNGLRGEGARVEKGFSGGGVYDTERGVIVGMIVESDTDRETRVAQFIGVSALLEALGRTSPRDALSRENARKAYLGSVGRVLADLRKAALHQEALKLTDFLDLEMDMVPDAVARTAFAVELPDTRTYTSVWQAFEENGQRLLILGAPGGGKTTALLRVAEQVFAAATSDPETPVPLLVNLSQYDPGRIQPPRKLWWLAWLPGQRTPDPAAEAGTVGAIVEGDFERWLVEAMAGNKEVKGHKVKKDEALRWLREGRVALFLDGLDEVAPTLREELVRLLNDYFSNNPRIPVVVCCRLDEYRQVQKGASLSLDGAGALRPLSPALVKRYLNQAGVPLLADRLLADKDLEDLAQTPLTLSMLALAYETQPEAALPVGETVSARRHALMEAFVQRMLLRKELRDKGKLYAEGSGAQVPDGKRTYTLEQVNRYLGWLAVQLSVRRRSSFPARRCYAFVSEKPSATESQKLDAPVATGMRVGWFLLGLLASGVVAASLFPMQVGQAVIAGTIALVVGGIVTALRASESEAEGVVLTAAVLAGVGLTGHAAAAVVPEWSPQAAILITLALGVGVGAGLAGLFGGSNDETPAFVLFFSVLGGGVLGVGLPEYFRTQVGFWPFPLDWTLAVCTVLALVGGAMPLILWTENVTPREVLEVAAGLVLGILVLALVISCVTWLVGLAVPHAFFTAIVAVVFLLLLACEEDLGLMALGLVAATVAGCLAGGAAGGTFAVWGFFLLLGLLFLIGAEVESIDSWFDLAFSHAGIVFLFLIEPFLDTMMRLVLAANGRRPLRWEPFLEYVKDVPLLKRGASGEFEFVHLLLRDYFALLKLVPGLDDRDPARRLETVRQMGLQGESAIDHLGERLRIADPTPGLREALIDSLGRIASPQVLPYFEEAMKNLDLDGRRAIVSVFRFRKRGDQATLQGWLSNETDVSVIMHWLLEVAGESQWLRVERAFRGAVAGWHLLQEGGPEGLRVFKEFGVDVASPGEQETSVAGAWLLAGLKPGETSVNVEAAKRQQRQDAIRAAIEAALGQGGETRKRAAVALGELGDPASRAALEGLLADPEVSFRVAAARALGELGEPACCEALEKALADPNEVVRYAATAALRRLGDGQEDADRPAAEGEPGVVRQEDDEVRTNYGLPPIVQEDESRAAAFLALAGRGGPESLALLQEALKEDASPRIRETAAVALGRRGDRAALPALQEALSDVRLSVRRAARRAIEALGAAS